MNDKNTIAMEIRLRDRIAELESLVNAQALAMIEQKSTYEAALAEANRRCDALAETLGVGGKYAVKGRSKAKEVSDEQV